MDAANMFLFENQSELLRTIAETIPVAITMVDRNGITRFANKRAEELLGLTRDELSKWKFNQSAVIVTALDGGPFEEESLASRRAQRTLQPVADVRYAIVRPDGRRVLVSVNAAPLFDAEHRFNGVVNAIVDITGHIEAEETIRHVNHLLEMTGEIAKVGGWEFDAATGKGTWTDEVAKIHDMDPREGIDVQKGLEFYTPESRLLIERAVREAVEHGTPYDLELEIITAKGVRKWVKTQGYPVIEQSKVVKVRGIFQDITERKKAEEERKRLETQLFQAQKVESIGILAAGIAHDFNNLLNIIMGNADLLASAPPDMEKLPKRVESITRATERGSQLVKQLLTFARKTEFEERTVILNDLILETAKLFEETFPKTIELVLKLTPGIPDIQGDANQLYQVLVNLCVNARDAMSSKGGVLTIATDAMAGGAVHAKFPAASTDLYSLLTITDTGTGMDDETQRRIFDPFFTTKERGKGTGLGLPVVQGIIETHHGFLEMESRPGLGTEFRIYLPGIEHAVQSSEDAVPAVTSVQGGGETILYIEDEPLSREMIAEFLEQKGYRVLSAANGGEGVALFGERAAEIALVVTDFGLPVFDGEEVVRRIQKIRPEVPIIMISGFIAPERKALLLALGVTDVLPKPCQLESLFERVRTILLNEEAHRHSRPNA